MNINFLIGLLIGIILINSNSFAQYSMLLMDGPIIIPVEPVEEETVTIPTEPSEPVQVTTCQIDSDCRWCGMSCVLSSDEPIICPSVMPPNDYECICSDQSCVKEKKETIAIPVKEEQTIVIPTPLSKPDDEIKISIERPIGIGIVQPNTITMPVSIKLNKSPIVVVNRLRVGIPAEIEIKTNKIIINKVPFIMANVTNPILQVEIETAPKLFHKVNIVRDITSNSLLMESGNVTVRTMETLRINNSKLYLKTSSMEHVVNVMPDTASQTIKQVESQSIKEMELKVINEKPMYVVMGVKQVKIFGFIKAKMNIESKIDADNGEIKEIKKPWWNVFVR